jgi:hypothetical protein
MAKPGKSPTPFQLWLEEAWEGWIRSLGPIVLVVAVWLLYSNDLLGEQTTATLAVLGIVGVALFSGASSARPLLRAPWQKALFVTALVVAAVATIYPSLRAAMPGRPLAEATFIADKRTATLQPGESGPYEVTVSGKFKQQGTSEIEATYKLTATGSAGGTDEIDGALKRQQVSIRSRKGGTRTSMQEHNEESHRLANARGPQLTLTVDDVSEELDGGLQAVVRRGSFDPLLFIVLGALALAMALVLDARLTDVRGKEKSYLTAAIGVAYVFAIAYPRHATAHELAKPVVAAVFLAALIGGLGGWIAGAIARGLFGPKIKKSAPARR